MTRIEDLKYARWERTAPADGAARVMAAGKRRRRTRYAVGASVVGVVALFASLEVALVSHSSNVPARPPQPIATKHPMYTAVGTVTGYPRTNPRYCVSGDFATVDGGTVTSDPCLRETILSNFDPRQILMNPTRGGTQSRGTVRVTGTYANGVLSLTKPAVAAKPAEPDLTFPLPCPPPPGGWHGSDPVNVSVADEAVMGRFAAAHRATFGGWWIARDGAPVIVAGVTTDVAGAQREIASKLQGDVCVTTVAHSEQYLASVADQLTRLAMTDKSLQLSGWGPSPVTSTVDVSVRIADEATVSYFASRFPPGVIKLKPFLTLVP